MQLLRSILRWALRVVGVMLGLVVLLLLVGAGVIVYDMVAGSSVEELANLRYPGPDGGELLGYLATPPPDALPRGERGHPAVLLIHEWWGLNRGITVLADALASEGYVVLAADAFQGRVTGRFPRALWMAVTTPRSTVFADLDAALTTLRQRPEVDPQRVATMGFCFGGGQSLQLGLRQSQSLAATIMYYGMLVTDPELLRPLVSGQPVLGVFGAEDNTIFTEDVLEFEAALNSLGVDNQITIYDGVGHAFVTEHTFDQPGAGGDAWQEALDFLARTIGDGSRTGARQAS